jgi:hypothetical protein
MWLRALFEESLYKSWKEEGTPYPKGGGWCANASGPATVIVEEEDYLMGKFERPEVESDAGEARVFIRCDFDLPVGLLGKDHGEHVAKLVFFNGT